MGGLFGTSEGTADGTLLCALVRSLVGISKVLSDALSLSVLVEKPLGVSENTAEGTTVVASVGRLLDMSLGMVDSKLL